MNRNVLAANAAGCVLILLAGECAMRALDLPAFDACRTENEYSVRDPELGFKGAPGSEVGGFLLNERGLRGPLPPEEKRSRHYRILFIGNSTCFGLGVQLPDTFASLSTRMIEADNPGITVDFANGAYPGYSSFHSRILLQQLLSLAPDLVVLYVGARNDHARARYFRDGDIPARVARLDAGWHAIRWLRAVETLIDRSYRSFFRKLMTTDARSRVPAAEFRENLRAILDLASGAGADVLVLIPPFSEDLRNRHPTIPSYEEILSELAEERGLPAVRLQSRFETEDVDALYFPDGYHFRDLGHRITAEEIRIAVAKHDLVARAQ